MNITKFEDLPISDDIKRAIADMGFEEPSPIQSQSNTCNIIRKRCYRAGANWNGKNSSV